MVVSFSYLLESNHRVKIIYYCVHRRRRRRRPTAGTSRAMKINTILLMSLCASNFYFPL